MLVIATKTKEITVAWDEHQSFSKMITYTTNRALHLFAQVFEFHVVVGLLIKKIHKTYLTSSQVTSMEVEVTIHLTKYIQSYFNELKHHFKEFMQEIRSTVSFIEAVIP